MTGRRTHIIGLVLAVVLCCSASDCDDDESEPGSSTDTSTETMPSAQQIAGLIEDGAASWLSGFVELAPVACPPGGNTVITSTDGNVQACAIGDAAHFVIRVQNRTDVPMSVWGSDVLNPFTVLPRSTLDIGIINPQFNQYLSYQVDTFAGLTSVLVQKVQDESNEQRLPGYGWASCALQPDPECLASSIASILPKTVTFHGLRIPVRLLGQGLALAFENRDLLSSFGGGLAGNTPGQLYITQAS